MLGGTSTSGMRGRYRSSPPRFPPNKVFHTAPYSTPSTTAYSRRMPSFHVSRRLFLGIGFAFCALGCRNGDGTASKPLTIAVIPKGATHEHWKRVHLGADKAAAEF